MRPRIPTLLLAVATVGAVVGCGGTAPSAAPSGATGARLVALADGRHMEIDCEGHGPVVVLEAGLGNTSDIWLTVQTFTQGFATVCRANRAGLGRSDPRPEPHGAASAVADLHELLHAAGLAPPYVLVGASFGGLVTNLFARTYPGEVSGVVFVDAIPPTWNAGLEALLTPAQVADRHAIPNGEPISNEELRTSDAAVLAAPAFPPVKLVVLRHGRPFPGDAGWPTDKVEALWAQLQGELATLSPSAVELQVPQAGHRIHQDQPARVADAIESVVEPSHWPPSIAPSPSAAP